MGSGAGRAGGSDWRLANQHLIKHSWYVSIFEFVSFFSFQVTRSIQKSPMMCATEEAQMFRLILKLMGAKKAIEVGRSTN